MLDVNQPGNEAGSIRLSAAFNAHREKLIVCREIRVSNIGTGEEPVQLCNTEGKVGVHI